MKKQAWMFSGQGSQYFQMGRELYETERAFRSVVDRGDAVVRSLINESVAEEVFRERPDRFAPFTNIRHTHPAIVLLECALAELLKSRGLRPDLLVGHSLGEFSALVVSGAVSLEDALKTVVKLSLVLEYCAPAGGMLAVIDHPDLLQRVPEVFSDCELAGVLFERSFLVSAAPRPLGRARQLLREKRVDTHELPVPFPFHTSAMDAVKTPSLAAMSGMPAVPPAIPVYSVGLNAPVVQATPAHLWEATRRATDFPAAFRAVELMGPHLYLDLGPSGSMATAVKYNLPAGGASEFAPLMTPFGQERRAIDRLLARVAKI